MPTGQPSNAPEDLPADARDDRTAAAVIADEGLDDAPDGGGPAGRGPGGAAPNSPLAGAMATEDGDADAGREARSRMAAEAPDERHPSSL